MTQANKLIESCITREYLKHIIHYDHATGVFTWNNPTSRKFKTGHLAGHIAHTYSGKRYLRITICNRKYLAHRLAFLYMLGRFPYDDTDHEDGNGLNNEWLNLRDATGSDNNRNQRLIETNTSGFCGVTWNKASSKWRAQVFIGTKNINLGAYDCKQEAIDRRKAANIEYGFDSNHGTQRPL